MWCILSGFRSLGCAVALCPVDGIRREPFATDLEDLGITVLPGPGSLRTFADRVGCRPDLVILSRPPVASALLADVRGQFPAAKVAYDTVDLHFVREARRRQLRGVIGLAGQVFRKSEIKRRREAELSYIWSSDVTIAVTDNEAAIIRQYVPGVRTVIVPNVYAPDALAPAPFEHRTDLLFLGAFTHSPNVDAAKHFVRDILPWVRREIDVQVWLVGSHPSEQILALRSASVVVTGYVPDLRPHFDGRRVFVSPLRYGAGLKGKNVQSMTYGLPMVTTSVGAEGMGLVDGQHALIRDDARGFASAVVDLYSRQPLWEAISAKARDLADRRWSAKVFTSALQQLLMGVTSAEDSRAQLTLTSG